MTTRWLTEPNSVPATRPFYDVMTGDDDHPVVHGALHGRDEPLTGTGTRGFTCTVAVEDLGTIRDRVVANGGTITFEEVEIPTVGTLTLLDDDDPFEIDRRARNMAPLRCHSLMDVCAQIGGRRECSCGRHGFDA